MRKEKKMEELDVDFIKSKPLTKEESIALSDFIRQLKLRKKNKGLNAGNTKKKLAA